MPTIKPPKGTRDFYPEDLLRRRYITETWRAVSIRHAFEEIDGPTFEHAELYAVKSGEGILGELFQAFSGKDEAEIAELRETGRAPFALRPEFTPTLARMYAARAKQLPKPTRWFCIPSFFRAEKPQRGRLREFFQWNADVIGEPSPAGDADVVACMIGALACLGLTWEHFAVELSDRHIVDIALQSSGVESSNIESALQLLDKRAKITPAQFNEAAKTLDWDIKDFDRIITLCTERLAEGNPILDRRLVGGLQEVIDTENLYQLERKLEEQTTNSGGRVEPLSSFCGVDFSIARGLAYYTGTVFEVIAEGERAVAGGGRYDNLIELFGGPPTPACGFGMGDVVLSNLLDDNDLFPQGAELMDAIARTTAQTSLRPEAFIVPASEEADEHIAPLLARLRRGAESEQYLSRDDRKPWHADRYRAQSGGIRPLHARTTDKSTRNLKKLLADAQKQFAKLCVIIHEPDKVQLKDFDTNRDLTPADIPALPNAARNRAEFSLDPGAPNDIARAIVALLDG